MKWRYIVNIMVIILTKELRKSIEPTWIVALIILVEKTMGIKCSSSKMVVPLLRQPLDYTLINLVHTCAQYFKVRRSFSFWASSATTNYESRHEPQIYLNIINNWKIWPKYVKQYKMMIKVTVKIFRDQDWIVYIKVLQD